MAELEKFFKQAQDAFNQRDWSAAKSSLAMIILEDSDYTGALDLLKDVQKRERAELKYQEGLGHFEGKNWEEAIEAFNAALRGDPDHLSAQVKLNEAQGWVEVERLRSKVDEHKRKSEWEKVVEALELLLKLQSSGLDLDWKSIEQQLASAREEAELKRLYQAGEWHFEQRNWLVAQQNFGELKQRRSDYPGLASKLKEIQRQLHLEELYRQAQQHEWAGEWSQAIELYIQVLMQDRDYPDVMARMAHCQEQLKPVTSVHEPEEISKVDETLNAEKKRKWPAIPLLVWFLLGAVFMGIIVLIFAPQLHCLLQYKLTESIIVIIGGLFGFVVVYFANFVSDKIKEALKCFFVGAAVVLLIAFVMKIVFSTAPSEAECTQILGAKPTLTPTLTMTPTTAIAKSSSGITPISELTKTLTTVLTPSSAPTGTPEPTEVIEPTEAVEPTKVTEPEAAEPTEVIEPTEVVEPTNTPIPTATPVLLVLLEPEEDAVINDENVYFKWKWEGTPLAEKEFFAVRVWHQDRPQERHSLTWIKALTYTLTLDRPPVSDIEFGPGYYYWNIAIVRELCIPRKEPGCWESISESEPRRLYIQVVPPPTPTYTPVPTPTPTLECGDPDGQC